MGSSTVRVTFIDDAASATMATLDLPLADLPDTFAIETTLQLGDDDWIVVSAEPTTKLEFASSGALTLRLRIVPKIDPSEILYSLPSICDRLPAVADTLPGGEDLILDEDDWRQFELVSRTFASETDAELAAIRAIHETERVGVGWKSIHVRMRPDPPIASPLGRDDLDRVFGGLTYRGVCFGDSPIVSGFSFRSSELSCYGVEEEGLIRVFGIAHGTADEKTAESLARIAHEFDFELVHWCRCVRAAWDDPLFRRLLTGDA